MTILHHIKIRSKNCISTSKRLISSFDLEPIAFRDDNKVFQLVLTAGQTIFIVTETKKENDEFSKNLNSIKIPVSTVRTMENDSTITEDNIDNGASHRDTSEWCGDNCSCSKCLARRQQCIEKISDFSAYDEVCLRVDCLKGYEETVYDVAFLIPNVYETVALVIANCGTIITTPTVIEDQLGEIIVAVVKSCVGNVFHTLIDSSKYSGSFLPGYRPIQESNICFDNLQRNSIHQLYTWADHVTYAVQRGTSSEILSWYEKVFKMKRFFLNSNDSLDGGFIIQGKDVGLRLYALNFWKCAEVGLKSESNMTIVLAESLEGQGPNQVDTFLTEHGCPGVQHVGLGTSDIYSVMEKLKFSNGVRFMVPPPTYYTKVGKSDEIVSAGEDLTLLEKYGILLDSEADEDTRGTRFLMQVFTEPLFSRNTFFLEIIQRRGARGFGAGNITALWRSVEVFLQQQKQQEQQQPQQEQQQKQQQEQQQKQQLQQDGQS